MGFSRQEYWSGWPIPSPGDLPDQGMKPRSPALQAYSLPAELPGKPHVSMWGVCMCTHACMYLVCTVLCFWDLWFDNFYYFWKILGHYLFKCFLCFILSLLFDISITHTLDYFIIIYHLDILFYFFFFHIFPLNSQFSSVAQSCPTLCNSTDYSTPGFPVHHQLPKLAQIHVHQVGDAI